MDAFYDALTPGVFQANQPTVGPWSPALQHGGPPAALLAHELEALGGPVGSRLAKVSFDFFGPVPVAQLSIETEVLRAGARIQLSTATMKADGRTVMRATAWRLLAEPGRSPATPSTIVVPERPPHATEARFPGVGRFPYGDAIEWRFVEGSFEAVGAGTVWTRCRIPLVGGQAITGLERLLVMVDAANGISAVLPITAWTFVPVDLTVAVHRLPVSDWIGMSAQTTLDRDGIGLTDTQIFDERGALGRALQTLYVAPR